MRTSIPRPFLLGLLAGASLVALSLTCQAATYSLSRDFSYTENSATSTWSYRLDDLAHHPPTFALLTSTHLDANALWGSNFPTPPRMRSEGSGYWGIGKNLTGKEQISTINGTRWAPGEVLFHPKAGPSPSRLVVGWTAPNRMVIDIRYAFGRAAAQGNGIGYEITRAASKPATRQKSKFLLSFFGRFWRCCEQPKEPPI